MPLRPLLRRKVKLLSASNMRLSLASISVPGLARQATIASVLASTTPTDLVGSLDDGTIGVFCLRFPDHGPDHGLWPSVEDRLVPRVQSSLRMSLDPEFLSRLRLWVRSVHRWATEVGDAEELFDLLSAAPSRVVGIAPPPDAAIRATALAPSRRGALMFHR
jgi:hypothetical protein